MLTHRVPLSDTCAVYPTAAGSSIDLRFGRVVAEIVFSVIVHSEFFQVQCSSCRSDLITRGANVAGHNTDGVPRS
jgi:hypothetical protein